MVMILQGTAKVMKNFKPQHSFADYLPAGGREE
jgi:hypothetical protein